VFVFYKLTIVLQYINCFLLHYRYTKREMEKMLIKNVTKIGAVILHAMLFSYMALTPTDLNAVTSCTQQSDCWDVCFDHDCGVSGCRGFCLRGVCMYL